MLKIIEGDITEMEVDVIVNSANPSLLAGGGVCGAIHKKAGPDLEVECKELGWCEVGDIRVTRAYNLSCKHVIHAVAPRYIYPEYHAPKEQLLADCYRKSIEKAVELGAKSIAFPVIGAGVYGWDKEVSIQILHDISDDFEDICVYLLKYR